MKQFFVALMYLLFIPVLLFAQTLPATDGFQFPSQQTPGQGSWTVGCNPFWGTCVKKYHTGEDASGNAGDPVYAPANGIIKHTGVRTSYGNVIVIEHDVNSEIVCSVLGHLRTPGLAVSVGDVVERGDFLGYLGTYEQNGNWTPHYHFGINKDPYRGDYEPGCAPLSWWYSGYNGGDACAYNKDDWYDPSDFVNSHPALVGYYPDGWHSSSINPNDSSQPILDAFNEHGGYAVFGSPWDNGSTAYVHPWPTGGNPASEDVVLMQDFLNGSTWRVIALNASKLSAFPVQGQILNFWTQNSGYLTYGPPMSTEYPFDVLGPGSGSGNYAGGQYGIAGDNLTVQKFAKLSNSIKTLVYNTRTGALGNFPVGQFEINFNPGEQWYVDDDGNPANDVPWPKAGVTAPTGKWWTDTGTYDFVRHDTSGNHVPASGFLVTIWEGNQQFTAPPSTVQPVTNLQATVISDTQINLTWDDNSNNWGGATGIEYAICESGQSLFSVFDQTNASVTGLTPAMQYTFQVRVKYQGNQSPLSASVTAATQGSPPTGSFISLYDPYPNPVQAAAEKLKIGYTKSPDITGFVKVELYRNGSWSTIIPSHPAGQMIQWSANEPAAVGCLIRVSSIANPAIQDVSASFDIIAAPPPPIVNYPIVLEAENNFGFYHNTQTTTDGISLDPDGYISKEIQARDGGVNSGQLRIEVVARSTPNGSFWPDLGVEELGNEPFDGSPIEIGSSGWQTYYFYRYFTNEMMIFLVRPGPQAQLTNGYTLEIDKVTVRYFERSYVSVTCDIANADYVILDGNGSTYATGNLPIYEHEILDGEYMLEVTAPGYLPYSQALRVAMGTQHNVQVTLIPNQTPAANGDVAITGPGQVVAINVLSNDSDVDGTLDPASVTVASQPTSGAVAVNPSDGSITYTPDVGYRGSDSFSYTVADNLGLASNATTVAITIYDVYFTDDFDRTQLGSDWSTPHQGTVTINNNHLALSHSGGQPPPNRATALLTAAGTEQLNDTVVELYFSENGLYQGANEQSYIYARYVDENNYYAGFIIELGTPSVYIARLVDGVSSINALIPYDVKPGRLRFSVIGNMIRFESIDAANNFSIEYIDSDPLLAGRVGVSTNEQNLYIDDFLVYGWNGNLPSNEPVMTSQLADPECAGPSFIDNGQGAWIKQDNGTATISFTNVAALSGNSCIVINNPSQVTNALVNVQQNLNLIDGHTYKLTFLTKGGASGPYDASIDVYTTDTWQPQGGWHSFELTNQLQRVNYQFTADHSAPSVIWFQYGNVLGESRIDSVAFLDLGGPVPTVNLLSNAGFETGDLSDWTYYSETGSVGVVNTESFDGDYSAQLVTNTAGEYWMTNLSQTIPVETNKTYKVTFLAKSSAGRTLALNLTENGGDWTWYGLWAEPNLITHWKLFEVLFESNNTDPNALFTFQSGFATPTVWIDAVVITTLMPDANLLSNASFESGNLSNWAYYSETGSISVVSTDAFAGDYSVKMATNSTGEYWMTELNQLIPIDVNQTYTISFYARASANRTIGINMTENGGDWTWYGLWYEPALTTEWRYYETSFMPNISDNDAMLSLQTGHNTATVWLDRITLIGQGQTPAKQNTHRAEPMEIPKEFALYQNYPNPFNPETQIRFDLPEACTVRLDIFNILGQKIATLVNRPLPAGQHSVTWNGLDENNNTTSSGLYIYKLQAAKFIEFKKMMFLK